MAAAAPVTQSVPMAIPRQPYPPPLPFFTHVERVAPVAVIVDRTVAGDAGFSRARAAACSRLRTEL